MTLALVIPAFQAERSLEGVWSRIPTALDIARIIVVDDGSTDRTAEIARTLGAKDPRLVCLSLSRNRGYGGAMKAGLAAAIAYGANTVACVHADGQYAPELLGGLLEALRIRQLDLLQGSRLASGTARFGGMPLYKYVAGHVLVALENRVLACGLTDYHSGYLIYGPRALEALPFGTFSDSFDFDLEVIAAAKGRLLAIGEEPIPCHYGDEVSHLRPVRYGLRVLAVLGKHTLGHYRKRG